MEINDLFTKFNSYVIYSEIKLAMRLMNGVQAPHIKKILASPYGTRLKNDLGLSKKEINKIIDELEEKFDVEICDVNREEIITREDIISAILLQLIKT